MAKYSLITAIIVAIVVQNTCPQGWAAKTAFATCGSTERSSYCPMHEQKHSKPSGQDDVKQGISSVKQAFVVHVVRPDNSCRMLDRTNRLISIDSLVLTEVFPDPILRPPIFCLFA